MTARKYPPLLRTERRILGSDAAIAVDRFRPEGPSGYKARSVPDAPIRLSRTEAEADERAHLEDDLTPGGSNG